MCIEDDRLRSEKESLRNDGIGAMFLENSDREGRQRLKLPKMVWSSAEQQFAVKGLHGFEFDSFSFILFFANAGWKKRKKKRLGERVENYWMTWVFLVPTDHGFNSYEN